MFTGQRILADKYCLGPAVHLLRPGALSLSRFHCNRIDSAVERPSILVAWEPLLALSIQPPTALSLPSPSLLGGTKMGFSMSVFFVLKLSEGNSLSSAQNLSGLEERPINFQVNRWVRKQINGLVRDKSVTKRSPSHLD